MADTAVAITAGTGTNIDTRTEATNGNHRQVVVLGDPATNAGVAPVDATNGLSVDVKASALPSGAATSAKQDTGNTSLATVAGAVSGTEMQVDVLTMPTVTVNSHAVTNAGTFAVQVDGAALTSLQLIDDTVATDGAATPTKGVLIAGQDGTNAQTIKTDTSGELQVDVLTMPTVTVDGSGVTQPVSNAGLTELAAAINGSSQMDVNIAASAISFGGTSAADDADFTATTTAGTPAMGVYESTPTTVTDGDLGTVGITSGRRLKTSATIDAALPAGANAIGKLAANDGVDIGDVTLNNATVAVTQSGTWDEVGINDSGNSITVDNPQLSVVGTGTEAAAMRVTIATDSTGVLSVDDNGGALTVDGAVTVTNATAANLKAEVVGTGTLAVQVDGSALTALQLIDDVVYTDDTSTHSTGTSKGSLIMAAAAPTDTAVNANDIGAVGMTVNRELYVSLTTALPAGTAAIGKLAANSGVDIGDVDVTSIAAGDNNIGNVDVVTLPALAAGTNTIGAVKSVPSDIDINGSNANHADKYYTNAGAVTDGIVWSPAAGKRWHVTTLYINVSAAATVTLEDDLAGGDVARWKGELAANSGVVLTYDKEHPFCSAEDAADLIITTSAGNVYVQAVGYEV